MKEKPEKTSANVVMKWLSTCFHSVLALLTLALLILFLLSAFSDHVAPQSNLYLSYLGILFPVFLILVVAWFFFLLLLRSWVLLCCVVATIALAHEPVFRYVPLHTGHPEPIAQTADDQSPQTLTILTYNTCHMGQTKLSKLSEKIPVVDLVRNSGADIVCLQEYGFSLSKTGHTEAQIRRSLKDLYPYYDYLPYYGMKAMGIAIYSRFPIVQKKRIDTDPHYFASMCYILKVHGREMAVINSHMRTNSIKLVDRRFYDDMMEHFETDSIDRIHYNLVRKLGVAYLARSEQSRKIESVRQSLGHEMPILICGDMNDTPISFCYHTVRGDLADTWQDAGFGPGITYYEHKFWFRIDHLFHSHHLHTLQVKVLDQYKYSDHYPLMATYQLLNP